MSTVLTNFDTWKQFLAERVEQAKKNWTQRRFDLQACL